MQWVNNVVSLIHHVQQAKKSLEEEIFQTAWNTDAQHRSKQKWVNALQELKQHEIETSCT
jgi:hypothetical protein